MATRPPKSRAKATPARRSPRQPAAPAPVAPVADQVAPPADAPTRTLHPARVRRGDPA